MFHSGKFPHFPPPPPSTHIKQRNLYFIDLQKETETHSVCTASDYSVTLYYCSFKYVNRNRQFSFFYNNKKRAKTAE